MSIWFPHSILLPLPLMRRISLADAATTALTICALLITGLLVRRELDPPVAEAGPVVREVKNWRAYSATGHLLSTARAPVSIIEFADFQCPFCRQSSALVAAVVDSLHGRVDHIYRHDPLAAIHPYAMMAAVASECAGQQGKFAAYHDELFAEQDSLGKRPWSKIALDAAVPDSAAFSACIRDSAAVMPRIRADMADATKLGIQGTPAILVNDRLFPGLPTHEQLLELVNRALRK